MNKRQKIIEIANRLQIPPEWLSALIAFETAGTYDPKIKNPYSSGRGLIQVIDPTAQSEFGAADSLALVNQYPDFNSQMEGVVYPYLKKYMPYTDLKTLSMAVFYPEYRSKPETWEFPEGIQAKNPGIKTVGDYVQHVKKRLGTWPPLKSLSVLTAAAVGAGILWIIRRR